MKLGVFGYPFHKSDFLNYTPLNVDQISFKIFQYGLKKAGAIRQINEETGLIYYSISTEAGQSGCPLIFGGSFVGTHSGGDEERKLNGGRLFD
jgi:hypothetical protein